MNTIGRILHVLLCITLDASPGTHTPITTTLPTPVLLWCSSRQSSYCHRTHTRTHAHTHTHTHTHLDRLCRVLTTECKFSDCGQYIRCPISFIQSFLNLLSHRHFSFPLPSFPSPPRLSIPATPPLSPPPPLPLLLTTFHTWCNSCIVRECQK